MKKILVGIMIVLSVAILMFVEYRYIMQNIRPYRGEGGMVYIETLGYTDSYYAPKIGGYEQEQ